jgi:uncharacterized protein
MDIRRADTFMKKLVGLLGTKEFPSYDGLFFEGVSCIHTFFMNYPIDVLFLDGENSVCGAAEEVRPYRVVCGPSRCRSVVEMRQGGIAGSGIKTGDIIHPEGG